jgi:predicted nuclease with TOPRIM domain
MALTKRELEEINEELQRRAHELAAENGRLTSTLSSSTARLRELEGLYAKLERRYERLRSLLIEHLDATA